MLDYLWRIKVCYWCEWCGAEFNRPQWYPFRLIWGFRCPMCGRKENWYSD